LQNQVSRQTGEPEAANCIAPERLSRISQAALKEALRTAKDLQNRLALDYQL
jgi:signal-transduction protein with cAMP-binding, CBS, and nucleotidyltransferase domain